MERSGIRETPPPPNSSHLGFWRCAPPSGLRASKPAARFRLGRSEPTGNGIPGRSVSRPGSTSRCCRPSALAQGWGRAGQWHPVLSVLCRRSAADHNSELRPRVGGREQRYTLLRSPGHCRKPRRPRTFGPPDRSSPRFWRLRCAEPGQPLDPWRAPSYNPQPSSRPRSVSGRADARRRFRCGVEQPGSSSGS